MTLLCLGADNRTSKWRPPLILACKSQPSSNGLHLKGSEFTTKSLWRTKTVKASLTAQSFRFFKGGWQLVFIAQISLRPWPDVQQDGACVRMCVCVCVIGQVFEECSALIGTGRHFVGLYCHMPLPILLLIRTAITGTHTLLQSRPTHFGTCSKLRPLHVISILLRCLVQ